MSFVTIGFLVSASSALFLSLLFRYEYSSGVRFAERARVNADFWVLKFMHRVQKITRYIGRELVRQVIHYIFHTVLRAVLAFLKRCEQGLRNMMRVNKTLAKNVERENATLSKLEEIALHKVATAMTEKEKKAHKEKVLNG